MDLYDELPQSSLLCDPEFTQLFEACDISKISVIDFITLNPRELARISQRSITEVTKFKTVLLEEFSNQYKTNNKIIPVNECKKFNYFTSGDIDVDETLGGGIYTHNITEVFGESSTGKSQFLMQLCLSVQLPKYRGGLDGKCVYITTEGDLPTQRLEGILNSRPELKDLGVSQKNIFTVSCLDLMSQEHILNVQLPILLDRNNGSIKLIIIDSISHHIRVELENKSFKESQDNRYYVDTMAEKLLSLADKYSLAIVVANQVGDKPLSEKAEQLALNITDYEYQLGWMVGWKDSTILYRQRCGGGDERTKIRPNSNKNQNQISTQIADDILSDDEDYMLIEKEVNRIMNTNTTNVSTNSGSAGPSSAGSSGTNGITKPSLNSNYNNNNNNSNRNIQKSFDNFGRRKRQLDIRVPNLGLSWANHISTRILLQKSYRASPMIKRGELKIYQGVDPSTFWQVKRTLQVVYSAFCQPNKVNFSITKRGIESVQ